MGITRSAAYAHVNGGHVPAIRIGTRIYVKARPLYAMFADDAAA